MRVRILGAVEVFDGTRWRRIAPAKPRALLAALLTSGEGPVSLDRLGEELWGDRIPKSAGNLIQQYVMRLRRELGDGSARVLVTRPPGYQLALAADELDAARFERLLAAGRAALGAGRAEQAGTLLREALGLWRGPALVDVPASPPVEAEALRLEGLRLDALELRIQSDVDTGGSATVIPELRRLVLEHPLRESLWAQLMRAQYRAGRQGDALGSYAELRGLLRTELGVEPCAELRELHQHILRGGHTHEGPGAVVETVPVAPAAGRPPAGPPRQLPAAVPGFVGREEELRRLSSGTPVSVISGIAGVGKTALALHWAHLHAHRFPDGQLYADLQGFGPEASPSVPAEVLEGFLVALAVPPDQMPPTVEAQAALLRSRLAGRRVLVVLDNAHDPAQVRPLLPGGPGCAVVVTSRSRLTGLAVSEGARLIPLEVFSPLEARALLVSRLGPKRVADEPGATAALIERCALHPLALAISAAHAAVRPGLPLAATTEELARPGILGGIDTFDAATDLRGVFSWSLRQLPPSPRRVFRLLALLPGPDISPAAAASLADIPPDAAGEALRHLFEASLVTERACHRFALHDLLRAYAEEEVLAHESEAGRAAATRRGLDSCLHVLHRAFDLQGYRRRIPPPGPVPTGVVVETFRNASEAAAWYRAARPALLAAIRQAAATGNDGHVWRLSWALSDFLHSDGLWRDLLAVQRTAVAAADRCGETEVKALLLGEQAEVLADLGEYGGAHAALGVALALQAGTGDPALRAQLLASLAWVHAQEGDHRSSVPLYQEVLSTGEVFGPALEQGCMLNKLGWSLAQLGAYDEALRTCLSALELHTAGGNTYGAAKSWKNLGHIHLRRGDPAEAIMCYRQAVAACRRLDQRCDEAASLRELGGAYRTAGDTGRARHHWRQALLILDELDHPDAGQVRALLGPHAGGGAESAALPGPGR